jgi:hypothetical protein
MHALLQILPSPATVHITMRLVNHPSPSDAKDQEQYQRNTKWRVLSFWML